MTRSYTFSTISHISPIISPLPTCIWHSCELQGSSFPGAPHPALPAPASYHGSRTSHGSRDSHRDGDSGSVTSPLPWLIASPTFIGSPRSPLKLASTKDDATSSDWFHWGQFLSIFSRFCLDVTLANLANFPGVSIEGNSEHLQVARRIADE